MSPSVFIWEWNGKPPDGKSSGGICCISADGYGVSIGADREHLMLADYLNLWIDFLE